MEQHSTTSHKGLDIRNFFPRGKSPREQHLKLLDQLAFPTYPLNKWPCLHHFRSRSYHIRTGFSSINPQFYCHILPAFSPVRAMTRMKFGNRRRRRTKRPREMRRMAKGTQRASVRVMTPR